MVLLQRATMRLHRSGEQSAYCPLNGSMWVAQAERRQLQAPHMLCLSLSDAVLVQRQGADMPFRPGVGYADKKTLSRVQSGVSHNGTSRMCSFKTKKNSTRLRSEDQLKILLLRSTGFIISLVE
jgi:hypothetical protein